PDEAPVFIFHPQKLRKRRPDAQPVDISGVDSRKEWLREALERLIAKAAAHKVPERFVLPPAPCRHKVLPSHPRLAGGRNKAALQERQKLGRDKAGKSLGKPVEPIAEAHEGA